MERDTLPPRIANPNEPKKITNDKTRNGNDKIENQYIGLDAKDPTILMVKMSSSTL